MLPKGCSIWTIVIVCLISSLSTYGWVLPSHRVAHRVSSSAYKSTLWYLRVRICHCCGSWLRRRGIHTCCGRSVIWIGSGWEIRSLYRSHISKISGKTWCNSHYWVVTNISSVDISAIKFNINYLKQTDLTKN